MLNQLHIFTNKSDAKSKAFEEVNIKIKEITKLAEKLKWNERFYKSYSGGKCKVAPVKIATCRVFVATVEGKEVGYIRIANYTETFSKFFDGEVWNVCEGYVKPLYRNALLAYTKYKSQH